MTPAAAIAPVLGELLRTVHFRSKVIFHGKLCDQWSIDTSGTGDVTFHAVGGERCWLHLRSLPAPRLLQRGDVVVMPSDSQHALTSAPTVEPVYGREVVSRSVPVTAPDDGVAMLCGHVRMTDAARDLLFGALPDHLVAGPRQPGGQQIARLTDAIFFEATHGDMAALAMVERLADALMLKVFELGIGDLAEPAGLYAGLADPQIGRALAAAWKAPAQPWTVESLASLAAMSRSVFAERFRKLVGKGPMEVLSAWRMQLAVRLLELDRVSVATVAERVGYSTEAAFRKAFKRQFGVGPGEVRKR